MSTASIRLRDNRRFAAYWGAHTVSQLGDRVGELALPLIAVTVLHATATGVGLLSAAVWLAYLASLFVGSWIDRRRRKRRIMVCADLARIAVVGTVPVVYVAGTLTLWHLYAVAVLLGLGEVFFNTAMPSVFVNLVEREAYIAAGSALNTSRSGSFIAGPALGGWLVQLLGAPFALLADALSYAGSALLLGRITLRESPPEPASDAVVRRAWAGLRFVLQHRYLRVMLGCSTTINFFNYVGSAVLVLFASRTLGLSAAVIGLAFGIGAGGSLLGRLRAPARTVVGRRTCRIRRRDRLLGRGRRSFPCWRLHSHQRSDAYRGHDRQRGGGDVLRREFQRFSARPSVSAPPSYWPPPVAHCRFSGSSGRRCYVSARSPTSMASIRTPACHDRQPTRTDRRVRRSLSRSGSTDDRHDNGPEDAARGREVAPHAAGRLARRPRFPGPRPCRAAPRPLPPDPTGTVRDHRRSPA